MHMPMKWRVVVLVVVAACVGTYFVLVVRSERVGDWCVHQGSARLARDAKSGVRYLDVSYTVTHPGKPLFSCMRLVGGAKRAAAIVVEYQSEKRAALVMEVSTRDGPVYQARLKLERTETWKRLLLPPEQFEPRGTPERPDGNRKLDLGDLAGRVEFYDDSSVKTPTTPFANRLKLTTPALTPEVEKPVKPSSQ